MLVSITTSTRVTAVLVVAKVFNDIIPIFAQQQNPVSGSGSSATSIRSSWIAFWVLWIVWALLLLADWTTTETGYRDGRDTGDNVERGDNVRHKGTTNRYEHGSKRASRVARDLLLGLLSALVMYTIITPNSIATSALAVEILTWIYFGLAIIWILTEIFIDNKIIRLAFGFVELGILLAIFSLAYARVWKSII